jgi:RimJ/RimL family protein N-acetyltransferase
MTEAAAVLEIAFGQPGLHRVFARLDPRNEASAGLCKRLGMRQEAYFVEDVWFYAILYRECAACAREAQRRCHSYPGESSRRP